LQRALTNICYIIKDKFKNKGSVVITDISDTFHLDGDDQDRKKKISKKTNAAITLVMVSGQKRGLKFNKMDRDPFLSNSQNKI